MNFKFDFLIIGAGIIGLNIARTLKLHFPDKKILIIEKEKDVAYHSSGRNSGVLHAGFYYSKDSLKAKFSKEGNQQLKMYCKDNNISVNNTGKVVVAKNKEELNTLFTLEKRGHNNNVNVRIIDQNELEDIEPNAKTYKKALYSPDTATVNPIEVCKSFKNELIGRGVEIYFGEKYKTRTKHNTIKTNKRIITAKKIINCAGLYADKIARDFGYSKNYIIIPFKGVYLKYNYSDKPIKTNIYPVPNLNNPFLGVHFTVTVDGTIKIGPTAIPAFWRENYCGLKNFNLNEFLTILKHELLLLTSNSFDFRELTYNEMRKYNKNYLIKLASKMVKEIDRNKFNIWTKPGIRAQLLNIKTLELLQDYKIEGDENSLHILNAVSPAFTCSMPFSKWIVEKYIINAN